jgi:hypothetical protein
MCNIDEKQITPLHHIHNVGRPKLYYTEDEIATAKREYSNRWYRQNKEKRISRIKSYQQQNRDAINSQRRVQYAARIAQDKTHYKFSNRQFF